MINSELANIADDIGSAFVVLSDEEYTKAIGQFRIAVGAVLGVFDRYGQGVYILGALTEIVRLAEDFGLRVRGVDKPISIEYIRRK